MQSTEDDSRGAESSESLLQSTLDHLPVGVALLDRAGKVVYFNDFFVKKIGYSAAEVPDLQAWWPLAYPDPAYRREVQTRWISHVRRSQELGIDIPAEEYVITCKDGSCCTCEIFARPMGSLDMVVLSDVTARKQVEQSLRQSQERYRNFIAHSCDGIWHYVLREPVPIECGTESDQLASILRVAYLAECNDAYARTLGFEDAQSITGRPLREFISLRYERNFEGVLNFIRNRFRPSKWEYLVEEPRGDIHWIYSSYTGEIENGLLKSVWGVDRDITERRRIEEELRAINERFSVVTEATHDVVWEWNVLTNETWRSSDALSDTGYCLEGLPATFEAWSARIHPDDRSRILSSITEVLENNGVRWKGEYQLQKSDGSWIHVDDQAQVIRDAGGKAVRMIGAARDITIRKSAERALRTSEARLRVARNELEKANASLEARVAERTAQLEESQRAAEAANRAKSEFLTNMSHEIRTPLHAISGMINLLEDTPLDQKQLSYLSKARDASRALLSIINDILDLSKIEAGKMEIEKTDFDLGRVIRNVYNTVAYAAEKKGLRFVVDIEPDVPLQLSGDPLRLGQVLTNLAGNAIKFTHTGEVVLHIDAADRVDEALRLRFVVQDTGIGLEKELIRFIKEPFAQADASITRKYGGTGLGLAICTRLLAQMGSGLEIESAVGKGSTFSFTIELPVISGSAPDIPLSPDKQRRVLVVDDYERSRQSTVSLLQRAGCIATAATTADEGATAVLAPDAHFDLVLIEGKLSGAGCIDAAHRLATQFNDLGRQAPVIAIMGVDEKNILERKKCPYQIVLRPLIPYDLINLFEKIFCAERPEATEARADFTGKTVLLVEDNPINQEVAIGMLREHGVKVITAEDGSQAVRLICEEGLRPDLILMDLQMPIMDGYEATKRIQAKLGACTPPIAAMTAHAFSEEAQRCLQEGMVAHITKPAEPEELRALLEAHLRTREGKDAIDLPAASSCKGETSNGGGTELSDQDRHGAAAFHKNSSGQHYADVSWLLPKFHASTPPEIDKLRKALSDLDVDTLSFVAHGLKGVCATMHATAMEQTCADIEAAARKQEWKELDCLLKKLQQQLEEVPMS